MQKLSTQLTNKLEKLKQEAIKELNKYPLTVKLILDKYGYNYEETNLNQFEMFFLIDLLDDLHEALKQGGKLMEKYETNLS